MAGIRKEEERVRSGRVIFVITRADTVGGAQIHVKNLAVRLLQLGWEPLVVTGPAGSFSELLRACGVPSLECPHLTDKLRLFQLAQCTSWLAGAFREYRPDLVSLHSSTAGMLGRVAACAARVPCIYTAHGWSLTSRLSRRGQTAYWAVERILAPLLRRLICVSEYDTLVAVSRGISGRRIVTIRNGVPDVRPEYRATPDRAGVVKVVMVARFDEPKQHHLLLEAAARVPNLHVEFVGDGPTQKAIERMANREELRGRVTFWGARNDVVDILKDAHIFALVSRSEGFPRSTLEGMRAGLPVVVSAAGGAGEAVEDEITGFVVPVNDIDALADRLRRLADDSSLRGQLGRAARRRYEREFTFEANFARTVEVYEEAAPALRLVNSRSELRTSYV